MGHFGAVIGHVLYATCALDVFWVSRVGHPKGRLIDPISFALDLVCKAKGLEHFHGAGVDAVGFALEDVGGHALHNQGVNFGKLGQLGGQTQAGGAGARNQDIDFFGQGFVGTAVATVRGGLLDVRAATTETIFVELHVFSSRKIKPC